MKQSRLMSLVESAINILVGFGISVAAQAFFLPMLGVQVSLSQNLIFAGIMTAISIARGFLLRRLFEALHIRVPLSPAVLAIVGERRRQIDVEGFDGAHDDKHAPGEMAAAGAMYALQPARRGGEDTNAGANVVPLSWPWAREWWKPQDDRRDLVRAGALIVAELDRIERRRRRRPVELPVFLKPERQRAF